MTIELLVYPALTFLAVALAAKFIARRRDVLYGPYIQGRKTVLANLRDRINTVTSGISRHREYGHLIVNFAAVGTVASAVVG